MLTVLPEGSSSQPPVTSAPVDLLTGSSNLHGHRHTHAYIDTHSHIKYKHIFKRLPGELLIVGAEPKAPHLNEAEVTQKEDTGDISKALGKSRLLPRSPTQISS